MASQIIPLSNGDQLQVRTGVIQGIGPQGPIGPTGPQGDQGDIGPTGVPGPMGQVIEFSSEFKATAQAVASTSTYGLFPFSTVVRDLLSAQKSTTNYSFVAGAAYMGSVTIVFPKPSTAQGSCGVRVTYASQTIAQLSAPTVSDDDTGVTVPFMLFCTDGSAVLQVSVHQSTGASQSLVGRLFISRVGPGPQGIQGDQGIIGPVGPTGPAGPIGPAGSLVDNNTTYATMGG